MSSSGAPGRHSMNGDPMSPPPGRDRNPTPAEAWADLRDTFVSAIEPDLRRLVALIDRALRTRRR